MKHSLKAGFTLIELLVVISILGILSGIGFSLFSAKDRAEEHQASEKCKQIADAWVLASRDLDLLDQCPIPSGVQEIDPEMCAILAVNGGYSVAYLDEESDNNARGLTKNKNADAELKYGLLSPIGLKRFKAGASEGDIKDHLYQFVYDTTGDGQVDTSDGMPAQLLPKGQPIAGKAAVWCWTEDEDERNNYRVLGKSW
jgi:prepilin-type N-terminal cleavage/methylation domain-containing protein